MKALVAVSVPLEAVELLTQIVGAINDNWEEGAKFSVVGGTFLCSDGYRPFVVASTNPNGATLSEMSQGFASVARVGYSAIANFFVCNGYKEEAASMARRALEIIMESDPDGPIQGLWTQEKV